MNITKSLRAFTLIETLVYSALFAILIGGAVTVAYTVFESAGLSQSKETLQQEGDFLVGKIEWALSGVQTISSPVLDLSAPTQSTILQVARHDGSTITISVLENCSGPDTTNIFLERGSDCFQLNNSDVQIEDLIFTREASSGGGINPESVSVSFNLTTTSKNGMVIEQNFTTTKYLRK